MKIKRKILVKWLKSRVKDLQRFIDKENLTDEDFVLYIYERDLISEELLPFIKNAFQKKIDFKHFKKYIIDRIKSIRKEYRGIKAKFPFHEIEISVLDELKEFAKRHARD